MIRIKYKAVCNSCNWFYLSENKDNVIIKSIEHYEKMKHSSKIIKEKEKEKEKIN